MGPAAYGYTSIHFLPLSLRGWDFQSKMFIVATCLGKDLSNLIRRKKSLIFLITSIIIFCFINFLFLVQLSYLKNIYI